MVGMYNASDSDYMKRVLLIVSVVLSIIGGRGGAGATPALKVLVPVKTSYTEFVGWSGSPLNPTFSGFCVEVFRQAARRLPSSPFSNYSLVPFGDGHSSLSYDDMIQMLQQGDVDVIVADLTINKDRLKIVDFTQPFMPSVLIMATPFRYGRVGTMWDFLQPFTMELWVAILFSFIGTGLVMFALEHKNPDFHQGQSKPEDDERNDNDQPIQTPTYQNRFRRWANKLVHFYWFTSLTLFFSQKESVVTHAGRFVTIVWLLVVLIFTSSYTASLASTLLVQQPFPTIKSFEFLLKSNVPIGYHGGSFILNYLTLQGIHQGRLKPLEKDQQYANALRLGPGVAGGVGAIVDEQPYLQSFLNTKCDFTAVDDQIAFFGGFGFAFAKNSSLTNEMSSAILSLAQDGTLQMLKDKWLGKSQCNSNAQASAHMKLSSFGGLFIILAATYGMCLVWRVVTLQMKRRMQVNIGRVLSVGNPTQEIV